MSDLANVQQPHARGAFRLVDSYPGVAVFKSYTCQGHLFEVRERPEHTLDDSGGWHVLRSMQDELEHVCPSDPEFHGDVCPFDAARLREPETGALQLVTSE